MLLSSTAAAAQRQFEMYVFFDSFCQKICMLITNSHNRSFFPKIIDIISATHTYTSHGVIQFSTVI